MTIAAPDSPAIAELVDRVAWITDLVAMRNATDNNAQVAAVEGVIDAFGRISSRPLNISRHQMLRDRLELSETEMQIVWLLAAAALDERMRQLMTAQAGLGAPFGRDSLRRIIYGQRPAEVSIRELGATGRLRLLGLVERADGLAPDVPEARWTWALSTRVLSWLHGEDSADASLSSVFELGDFVPPIASLAVGEAAIAEVRKAMRASDATLLVTGKPGLGRRTLLTAAAKEIGLDVAFVRCSKLSRDPAVLTSQLRGIVRECRLLSFIPLLQEVDTLSEDDGARLETVGRELVALMGGLVLATCGVQRPALRWNRPVVSVGLEPPTTAQLEALWRDTLGTIGEDEARTVANIYPLAPALVHEAARAAKAHSIDGRVSLEEIAAGVRSVLDDRIGRLATRVTTKQSWTDIVLPEDQAQAIRDLIGRVRGRTQVYEQWGYGDKLGKGLGLCALFSGPPGTGKTMVAALIAKELGLELYQVDLARVVSKWIGESEKNLAAIFDAAEAGHAILLFDEADSLFGKRTEVRSSNDRYANLETNYLLQRIETFTGICVLTSNHESNIDPAFQRRMTSHVRFEMPDEAERARLWRALIPSSAPVARDIDFRRLARSFEMAGGAIRNASLRAAFMAAEQKTAIGMVHLERAARFEYEALGKIASSAIGI